VVELSVVEGEGENDDESNVFVSAVDEEELWQSQQINVRNKPAKKNFCNFLAYDHFIPVIVYNRCIIILKYFNGWIKKMKFLLNPTSIYKW
jgi:hypothetical protein